MRQQLEDIKKRVEEELAKADIPQELENLRIRFLGKKGELTSILKQMGKLSAEERPVIGQLANEIRGQLEKEIEERGQKLKAMETERRLKAERIDVTMPGKRHELGYKHPLSIVLDELKEIFLGMGFDVVQGPEVESVIITSKRSTFPRTIPLGIPRIPSISTITSFFAPRPLPCRFAPWKSRSLPSASSPRAGYTVPTRWTPPTLPSFIRSRA